MSCRRSSRFWGLGCPKIFHEIEDSLAHQLIGVAIGIASAARDDEQKYNHLHHPLAAGAIGAFFGKLPDVLEPSLRNLHHRQFFHSFAFLGMVGWGVYRVSQWEPRDELEKWLRGLLLIGGLAYMSHLVVDAFTSRSLPLVGRL